jgi:hypothetical protein
MQQQLLSWRGEVTTMGLPADPRADVLRPTRQSQSHITSDNQLANPVRLGVRSPCGTRDQFFFLLEIFL